MGFAVNPEKEIIDLSSKISTSWENGLDQEMEKLLGVYKNLDDTKKVIAEFFAGSSKGTLPPPGFFICIALQLAQKYKQNLEDDIKMLFVIGCGIFDAAVSAWYYKAKFNQAHPISLIRNNLTNQKINVHKVSFLF